MGDKQEKKETRSSNWSLVIYPESAPKNWREIIDDYHVAWAESPLHDKDYDDDVLKKAHWHIVISFDSLKSYEQVVEITKRLKGPIPKKTQSVKGSIRYFAHLDHPDKAQYKITDIITHGGFDTNQFLKPTSSERYSLIRDMINYIKEYNVHEFQDLMDFACEQKFETWFPLLCDNSAYVVGQYIKSQRHRNLK